MEDKILSKQISHIFKIKKAVNFNEELWVSLTQMEPEQIEKLNVDVKLAVAAAKKGMGHRESDDCTCLYFALKGRVGMQEIVNDMNNQNLAQLIQILMYERFQKYEIICKYGQETTPRQYFILKGRCILKQFEVEKEQKSDGQISIRKKLVSSKILGSTDSFGENLRCDDSKVAWKFEVEVESNEVDLVILRKEHCIGIDKQLKSQKQSLNLRLIKFWSIFKEHLNSTQINHFAKFFQPRQFTCKQIVYAEGDSPPFSLFIIISGRFQISKKSQFSYHIDKNLANTPFKLSLTPKVQKLAVLSQGGSFGEEEVLRKSNQRQNSVICESTQGELLEITSSDFLQVLSDTFNEQEIQFLEDHRSMAQEWREVIAKQITSVQQNYSDYLSKPPRFSTEANQIVKSKSISSNNNNKSIKQVNIMNQNKQIQEKKDTSSLLTFDNKNKQSQSDSGQSPINQRFQSDRNSKQFNMPRIKTQPSVYEASSLPRKSKLQFSQIDSVAQLKYDCSASQPSQIELNEINHQVRDSQVLGPSFVKRRSNISISIRKSFSSQKNDDQILDLMANKGINSSKKITNSIQQQQQSISQEQYQQLQQNQKIKQIRNKQSPQMVNSSQLFQVIRGKSRDFTPQKALQRSSERHENSLCENEQICDNFSKSVSGDEFEFKEDIISDFSPMNTNKYKPRYHIKKSPTQVHYVMQEIDIISLQKMQNKKLSKNLFTPPPLNPIIITQKSKQSQITQKVLSNYLNSSYKKKGAASKSIYDSKDDNSISNFPSLAFEQSKNNSPLRRRECFSTDLTLRKNEE